MLVWSEVQLKFSNAEDIPDQDFEENFFVRSLESSVFFSEGEMGYG